MIGIIICGTTDWEEHTFPLIDSILKHEKNEQLEISAVGTKTVEMPERYKDKNVMLGYGDIIDGYATAINLGFIGLLLDTETNTIREFDWVLIMNNDVLCEAPFVDYLKTLDTNTLYGNKIHTSHRQVDIPYPWIDGWIYAVPGEVFDTVGFFDGDFKIAGFEDADFCLRAYALGYEVKKAELPFKHLEIHSRFNADNYKHTRLTNMKLLAEKHELRLL